MDKSVFIALLIEAGVTLIPLITAIMKVGAWKKGVEADINNIKGEVHNQRDEMNGMKTLFENMNKTLTELNVKVGLLLEDKIKK